MKKLILAGVLGAILAAPTYASNMAGMHFKDSTIQKARENSSAVMKAYRNGKKEAVMMVFLLRLDALAKETRIDRIEKLSEAVIGELQNKRFKGPFGKTSVIYFFEENPELRSNIYATITKAQKDILEYYWKQATEHANKMEVIEAKSWQTRILEREELFERFVLLCLDVFEREDVRNSFEAYKVSREELHGAFDDSMRVSLYDFQDANKQKRLDAENKRLTYKEKRAKIIAEDYERGILHSDGEYKKDIDVFDFVGEIEKPVAKFPLYKDWMSDEQLSDYNEFRRSTK